MAVTFSSIAQFSEPFRSSKIVLKTGDTLTGMGKTRNKGFKYKPDSNTKPYFIEFSEIAYLEQKYSYNEVKVFRFFQLTNNYQFIRVEEFNIGGALELYGIPRQGDITIAGGSSVPTAWVNFCLKKKNDEKLTEIGFYDPFSDYKDKVKNYFSDCPKLIEQIENKSLRLRNGLEPMVEYYNNNCGLE
ncbi:hypothetical protein [Maribacter sp. 2307UL18-2]|uniref:hypothetical protein n=1 Tax=Maribacter sp. 2307UL18-2 TaxID=3386274 RepID=UPI0039BD55CF